MHPSGLIPNRTYTVVPVRCCEYTCCYHKECGEYAGDIGLLDEQDFQPIICHEYKSSIFPLRTDKEVLWERIRK